MRCKMCGGPCGILGRLGNLIHYVCRNCGAQYSRKAKPKKGCS